MTQAIVLACDHAAFNEKEDVKSYLQAKGCELIDVGTNSIESCNYADFAIAGVKKLLEQDSAAKAVFICGTGIGISMAANRFKNIRAAVCRSTKEVEMTRLHNDANVLCLGSRVNTLDEIKAMIDAFLSTEFEGGRHINRINIFNELGQ